MYEVAPDLIWWNGDIVPWGEARVHVTSEVAMRGTNVFEGLRAYWTGTVGTPSSTPSGTWNGWASRPDCCASPPTTPPSTSNGCAGASPISSGRSATRTTSTCGRRSTSTKAATAGARGTCGSAATSRTSDRPRLSAPMNCVVSSWRRTPDQAISPLIKVGAAYQAFRLPRIEAAMAGADEAILLNTNDTVAETGGRRYSWYGTARRSHRRWRTACWTASPGGRSSGCCAHAWA